MTKPAFFENAEAWREWLEANHAKADEISVGFRKQATKLASITYQEAVDAALSFGWIDGVRNSMGETSYRIRFTPRRKGSIWSAVNIARVAELKKDGLMHAAGIAAFEGRDKAKSKLYSHEQKAVKLAKPYEAALRANAKAWAFFQSQPPSYRRPATWWVMSAKKDETRERRLGILIEDSEAGRRIAQVTWKPRKDVG